MGIAERKQREKEARIRQIQNSAASIFYKKGYGDTTMDEIAQAAEISKATIYLYFKSKEDLYFGIIEPALNKLGKRLVKIAGDKSEAADLTVKKLTDATYDFYEHTPDAYHLVSRYNAAEFARLLPPGKLDHLKALMRSNLDQLEAAVRKGIQQGIFNKVDPRLVSIIIWNCFMGVIQYQENRMEQGKSDYRRSTLEAAVALIMKGLKKR